MLPDGTPCFTVRDLYGNLFLLVERKDVFIPQGKLTGGVIGASVGVTDMEASIAFYRDILGYTKVIVTAEEGADLYAEADKQKIERPKEEREATDERLRQTLKALIARDLWDMNEYFAIVYEDDPIVTTAVKKLSEPDLP